MAGPRLLVHAPTPLEALEACASSPYLAFLDGAAEPGGLGRWSYLAHSPSEVIEASAADWPDVRHRLRQTIEMRRAGETTLEDGPPFQGGWIGWISYEAGRAFDRQPLAGRDIQSVPDISFARYDAVLAWDHLTGRAWHVGATAVATPVPPQAPSTPASTPHTVGETRDFTPESYRAAVECVIDYIHAGDIFQANLSQQFRTPFAGDPLALYRAMRRRAPGSHAAYLDRGRVQVLSMSPERFLAFDPATQQVEARPIKGTRPRDRDPQRDRQHAEELSGSAKDRAENVMIVDLLRNDLHKVCDPASVQVPVLCALESHAAVHHLVSTVTATLERDRDAIDLIEAAFPGGSITGAPKLRAMEILAELEPVRRGVYCGAIGWLGFDGKLDLNIAIRTVTVANGMATIAAGGGITARSDPAAEYQETLDKAAALRQALEDVA